MSTSARYCQGILDEQWRGRAFECGAIQLTKLEGLRKLILQCLLSPLLLQVVPLQLQPPTSPSPITDHRPPSRPQPKHIPHPNPNLHPNLPQVVPVKLNDLCWQYQAVGRHTVRVGRLQALIEFFRIPLVKLATSIIFYCLYALLATYFVFSRQCGPVNPAHYMFTVWTFANLVEEAVSYMRDPRLFWREMWNLFDLASCACLTLGIVFRLLLLDEYGTGAVSQRSGAADATSLISFVDQAIPAWGLRDGYLRLAQVAEESPTYLGHMLGESRATCRWSLELELLRIFSACGLFLLITRMLEFLTMARQTGVLILCMRHMLVKDLATWLKPTSILVLAFAVGNGVLLPTYQLEGTVPLMPIPTLNLDLSVGGPIWAMLWALFGYYEPATLDQGAPGASVLAPLWLWLFLLVALVLLVNLLIAMFSNTYQSIMESADAHWRLTRVASVKTYVMKDALPPPFNLVELAVTFLMRLGSRLANLCSRQRCCGGGGDDSDDDDDEEASLVDRDRRATLVRTNQVDQAPLSPASPWSRITRSVSSKTTSWAFAVTSGAEQSASVRPHHWTKPKLHDSTLFTFAHAQLVEGHARSQLVQQRQYKRQREQQQLSELRSVEQRLKAFQTEAWESTARLEKTIDKLGKRPLLSQLPAKKGDLTGEDARLILADAISGFGHALNEAVLPIKAKVDKFDGALKELQKKLGVDDGPTLFSSAQSDDKKGEGGGGGGGYLQSAHALGSHAYQAVLPPAHRMAPSMPPPQRALMPLEPPPASGRLGPLPPPQSTDAGPEPEPYPREVIDVFRRFDRDNSRGIDIAELRAALVQLGLQVDTAKAASVHDKYDTDRTGVLELNEFAALVADWRAFQASQAQQGPAPQGPPPRAQSVSSVASEPIAPYTTLPPKSAAADDEIQRIVRRARGIERPRPCVRSPLCPSPSPLPDTPALEPHGGPVPAARPFESGRHLCQRPPRCPQRPRLAHRHSAGREGRGRL